MELLCVGQVPGQHDTLRGVSTGISELLDPDFVKGFLEAVTGTHCQQASRAWQHCLGVAAQGDTLVCGVSGYRVILSCAALRWRCQRNIKEKNLCFMHLKKVIC